MTKIQEDIILTLDNNDCKILTWDYAGSEVIVWCQYGNTFYRYTIDENGYATKEVFMKDAEKSCVFWSMEEHDWATINPLVKEKTNGDVSFDVVVEKEIKKEKENKKMINFNSLYKEAYLDAFKDYVRENKEDLNMYADDTAREKIIEHINDNVDFEDVAHNIIDEMIDYYIEYDGEADDDDLEQIICDYIFE